MVDFEGMDHLLRLTTMQRVRLAFLVGAVAAASHPALAQARRLSLRTTEGLRVHNTTVAAVLFQGRRAVRVEVAAEVAGRPEYRAGAIEPETFVRIEDLEFNDGVIEVELAAAPVEGAYPGARGFAGIAFPLQPAPDSAGPPVYDAFYLRPTNGRAMDQERRNHATQYISHPAWTWSRLHRETPSRYEAYVDLAPATWTRIRIEVRGAQARLYVHGQPPPTLLVTDVKSGPSARAHWRGGSGRAPSRTSATWWSRHKRGAT
jgi:hypothetical protein